MSSILAMCRSVLPPVRSFVRSIVVPSISPVRLSAVPFPELMIVDFFLFVCNRLNTPGKN